MVEAVGKSLDGAMLTREQLAVRVSEMTGSPALGEKLRESWGGFLKPASFQGKLCFAPNLGRNVRFTLPRWWLGDPGTMDRDEALTSITRRFLGANGPATRDDYARWWAISPAQALRRLKMLGDEAEQIDVEGAPMWMLADHAAEAGSGPKTQTVRLLPAFDQYVIAATRHVEHLLPGPVKARIYRPQGWISPVLLINGRMEGVWQFEKKGDRLLVSIEPFGEISGKVKDAIRGEAESLGRYHAASELELEFIT
jgi:winged helix DNA-binding protein